MKNQITLLVNEVSNLSTLTHASLIGYIEGVSGTTHYGVLAEDKEHSGFINIINRDVAVLLYLQKVRKKTACGAIEFQRRAKMIIECGSVDEQALKFLAKRATILKSRRGLVFLFNLEGDKELPDVMPCPLCGYAAHFDEDVYSTGKLHLMCDSEDPGSCGETLIWETVTTKNKVEEKHMCDVCNHNCATKYVGELDKWLCDHCTPEV